MGVGPFPCCTPGLCMDELMTMSITSSGRWGGAPPPPLQRRPSTAAVVAARRRGGGGCSRREPPPHATRGGRRGRFRRLDGRPAPTGTSRHGPGSIPPPPPQSPQPDPAPFRPTPSNPTPHTKRHVPGRQDDRQWAVGRSSLSRPAVYVAAAQRVARGPPSDTGMRRRCACGPSTQSLRAAPEAAGLPVGTVVTRTTGAQRRGGHDRRGVQWAAVARVGMRGALAAGTTPSQFNATAMLHCAVLPRAPTVGSLYPSTRDPAYRHRRIQPRPAPPPLVFSPPPATRATRTGGRCGSGGTNRGPRRWTRDKAAASAA